MKWAWSYHPSRTASSAPSTSAFVSSSSAACCNRERRTTHSTVTPTSDRKIRCVVADAVHEPRQARIGRRFLAAVVGDRVVHSGRRHRDVVHEVDWPVEQLVVDGHHPTGVVVDGAVEPGREATGPESDPDNGAGPGQRRGEHVVDDAVDERCRQRVAVPG